MIKQIGLLKRSVLSLLAGLTTLVLGIIVLIGWAFRVPLTIQLIPEFVAMVFNTALCFVIASFAVISPHLKIRAYTRIQFISGCVLILIGCLVLIETFFGIDLLIDWVSLHQWLHDGNPTPGRMAPNTALGFICCGAIFILLQNVHRSKWIAQSIMILTFLLIIIGVTGIAGYFLKLEAMYSWYQHTRMAITTAIGMTLLGIAIWLDWHDAGWYKKHYSQKEDEQISTTAVVVLIGIALATGLTSFVTLQNKIEKSLGESISLVLNSRADLFSTSIENRLSRAGFTANRPSLIHSLRKLSINPNDNEAIFISNEALRSFVPLGFSGLAIYDLKNSEIASSGRFIDTPELEIALTLPYEAMLQWENGFYLRTRLKILDKGSEVGYIIAEQPLPILTKFMFSSSGIGKTEEMGLCGLIEEKIFCFPQRVNSRPYTVPSSVKGKRLPITYAFENKTGLIKTIDYRSMNVIAAYAPLEKLGLAMVLKIDTTELYAPIREQLQIVIPILLILITIGGVFIRLQLKPLALKLIESEQDARSISKQLAQEKSHIQAIVEHVADGIITMDENGVIKSFNPSAEKIFGYPSAEVMGKNLTMLVLEQVPGISHHDHDKQLALTPLPILSKGSAELSAQRKDGTIIQIELNISEMYAGDRYLFIAIMRDITERKLAEQRLTHLAQYDSLTGLANRFLFNDQLQRAMARSLRNRQLMGLMYLDIDYFKNINDEMGHDMGDALLKNFAARLKECVRETDTIARLGGDEFTIILEGLHQQEDASLVAQKIVDKMKTGFYLDEHYLFVTASIGIAICLGNDVSAEVLIKKADQALYRAKEAGRNGYRYSE